MFYDVLCLKTGRMQSIEARSARRAACVAFSRSLGEVLTEKWAGQKYANRVVVGPRDVRCGDYVAQLRSGCQPQI